MTDDVRKFFVLDARLCRRVLSKTFLTYSQRVDNWMWLVSEANCAFVDRVGGQGSLRSCEHVSFQYSI